MIIPLIENDWESWAEDVSRLRVHNMYVTEDLSSPDGLTRVSRPTLKYFATVGTGPINGIWRQDGTLSGDWFIVSGNSLYRMTVNGVITLLGSVPGIGYAQYTGTTDRVIILRDSVAYSTDGVTLSQVTMPDGQSVGSITSIDSFILLSVKDSDRFYWIEPGGTNPDALNFATAEHLPDPIVSMHVVSDEIWLLGTIGPEIWTVTGDLAAPFQRIPARVYNEGCKARDAAVIVIAAVSSALTGTTSNLPALVWVTDTGTVVIAQGSPRRISNESVEEFLKTATNLRAWTFRYNRHSFYVLGSDQQTIVYDLGRGKWLRWDTYLKNFWSAHLGGQVGSTCYAGDAENGTIWLLEEGYDDNGVPVIREIAGIVPNTSKFQSCNEVMVKVNSGHSPSYTDEPILELRWSDDQGVSWSAYRRGGLGMKGKYTTEIQFNSLGLIKRPGRIFEFRFTGHSRFRLDYATMNEK